MNKNAPNRSQHYLQLILEIYKRIPKHRKTTAKEIQQQLTNIGIDRSERSIQRNLADMVQFFDDIEMDNRDKPYGYTRRSNDLLSSTLHGALLLHLTTHYLRYLLPVTLTASMENILSDTKRLFLPENANSKERQWVNKIGVVNDSFTQSFLCMPSHIFEPVSYALFHNRLLSLTYTEGTQAKKIKEVMPLGLVQQGEWLYLIYQTKEEVITYSICLHHIIQVSVSTFSFTYPSEFTLQQYLNEKEWKTDQEKKHALQGEI